VAEQLWRALDLRDAPPSLRTHVERILELGISGDELIDRVVAMGSIAGADRPIAVVIRRLGVIGGELKALVKAQTQRRQERRQQLSDPIERENDPAKLKYEQVLKILGPTRCQEIEDALVEQDRRGRKTFMPKLIMVAKWASEQEDRYPDLDLSEALHRAMNTLTGPIGVNN
jgi:hypothetical protein